MPFVEDAVDGAGDHAPSEVSLGTLETAAEEPLEKQMRSRVAGRLFGDIAEPVKIGRFVVLGPLGAGGLGVVVEAYDPELDRKVAIKLLKPGAGGEDSTERMHQRMQREAQAMAQLSHPNVVAVHDVGRHAGGVFLAMELVDGVTLGKWWRSESRTWQEIRDVLVQAGRGMEAAHRLGIVHRDFKPANVLVDREGRVRVLDFGLARLAQGELVVPSGSTDASLLSTDLTATGAIMGTPAYMAPEQFTGQTVDARADQWSFCVTAFEGFFRKRPFDAPGPWLLRNKIIAGEFESIDGNRVPGWVRRVVLRGLSVDPSARFASMTELLDALTRDRRSRRKWWIAAAAAALLSVGTATVTAAMVPPAVDEDMLARIERLEAQARQAAAQRRFVYPPPGDPTAPTALTGVVELEQLQGAGEDLGRERAEALRREFASELAELGDRFHEREGGEAFAADFYAAALLFDPDQARARARTSMTPGEVATLRKKAETLEFSPSELRGGAVLDAILEDDEQARLEKVAELYASGSVPSVSTGRNLERLLGSETMRALAPGEPTAESPVETESVGAETPDARTPEIPPQLDPEPETEESAPDSRADPQAARAEVKQGRAALSAGRLAEAERYFHRALAHDRRSAAAMHGLGEIHFERGEYEAAVRYAKKAVARAPRSAKFRLQLGHAYFKVVRYGEARREYEKARDLGSAAATKWIERVADKTGG